jgi:hypothetical protein
MTHYDIPFPIDSSDKSLPEVMAEAVESVGEDLHGGPGRSFRTEELPSVLYRILEDYSPDFYILSRDTYGPDTDPSQEIGRLREQLDHEGGFEELGVRVSKDGTAYLMAIRAPALDPHIVCRCLDKLILRARSSAYHHRLKGPPAVDRHVSDFAASCQSRRHVAEAT